MKAITIRFPKEVYEALKEASKKDNRSINNYVVVAVEEKMKG